MIKFNKLSSREGLSKEELISTSNRDNSYKEDYNSKDSREDKLFNKAKVTIFKYRSLRLNKSIIMITIHPL